MSIQLTGGNLIAGEVTMAGSQKLYSANPRTREAGTLPFANATPEQIDAAVAAAQEAFATTRRLEPQQLARFLEAAAEEIENVGAQLIETADWETALGEPRLTGELARTTGQLRQFATLLREGSYVEAIIDTAQPHRQPAPRPSIRRMQAPIGPVAVFSASNFPFAFAVAGGDTASAWAAGCPVVVKGHPSHPATSELFGHAINRALSRCALPPGFFSLLQGERIDVGQNLVMHPGIAAVGFTGSLAAGRAIYNMAATRSIPIPVYAEMGSVNPVVILPGAIQEQGETLAQKLQKSATLAAGQFCTNPGLVLMIDDSHSGQFIRRYAELMQRQAPGVLLNKKIEESVAGAVRTTLSYPEVQLLAGEEISAQGFCYPNTVLRTTAQALRQNEALQAEHFGPVTLFVLCQSIADLQEMIPFLHGSLTATIHAAKSETATAAVLYELLREKAGRLLWNGFPTGVEVVYAMQHGGPYPATTAPATTSVGMTAVRRFMRPVAYQNFPDELLPAALQDANPLNIWRIVDGEWTKAPTTPDSAA